MFHRLRAAWAVFRGQILIPHDGCARCLERERTIEDLREQVRYWRGREERTADALHAKTGVLSKIAAPPAPKQDSMMAVVARGLAVTEIDSSRSHAAGQAAMTRGDAGH